jgi:hypothetical protein
MHDLFINFFITENTELNSLKADPQISLNLLI